MFHNSCMQLILSNAFIHCHQINIFILHPLFNFCTLQSSHPNNVVMKPCTLHITLEITCRHINVTTHMELDGTRGCYNYGYKMSASCEYGYEFQDGSNEARTITCSLYVNGEWSENISSWSCLRKMCFYLKYNPV